MIFGVPTAIVFVLFGIYLLFAPVRTTDQLRPRKSPWMRVAAVALILIGLHLCAERLGWL